MESQCLSTTGLLVAALIFGILGGCFLLIPIIGTIIGLVFLSIAFILALIGVGILGRMLWTNGLKTQNRMCKVLIVLSCLLFAGIIALIAVASVNHISDNQPATPIPSNTDSTAPSQPSN